LPRTLPDVTDQRIYLSIEPLAKFIRIAGANKATAG
jgi:hypothetical protein